MGFYLAFGTPILFYTVYQLSQTESGRVPFITGIIDRYTKMREADNRKVALHMAASDQAALDRHLFSSETKSGRSSGIDLRYPEYV